MKLNRRQFSMLALAAGASSVPAFAKGTYPERPIELIVPFAPGGGTDLSARLIVPYIEKYLNGTIAVINKPGAGGQVGAVQIARAKPDGYTIGFMNVPNTMMKPHERDAGFTVDSFDPIANLVFDPAVLATRADSKYKTLADVVAECKARPGKVTIGSAGIGSNTHLDLLRFEHLAGIKFHHIPYDGGAAPRTALLGGHLELIASALGDCQRFQKEGTIRMLGILTKERFPMAPDVPTYAEQGYPLVGSSRPRAWIQGRSPPSRRPSSRRFRTPS
jgi:tripartite-type tricarboxylate transporter receptor subunit TctC